MIDRYFQLLGWLAFFVAICFLLICTCKCYDNYEPFSPLGCSEYITTNKPTLRYPNAYYKMDTIFNDDETIYGSCGPGCVFKCNNKHCPNNHQGYSTFRSEINEPLALPLNANANVTLLDIGGDAGCTSADFQAFTKSNKNPYGYSFPGGKQSYAYCDKNA